MIFTFLPEYISAQQLYYPLSFRKALKAGTRTETGLPGKNYWQNKADYDLNIHFNPADRMIKGSEVVTYYNNRNDTLHKIVFRIYPDYYKKGVLRDYALNPQDETNGLSIDKMIVGKDVLDAASEATIERFGTLMNVMTTVLPHSKIDITVDWHYILNKGSHMRTGAIDESSFFIAYCFPRIAVYDDIEGWDESEYLGTLEPYADFGNFKLAITVPENFMVWSTGELANPEEVMHLNIYKKWLFAQKSNLIDIITEDDIRAKKVTASNAWNTFRFNATDVPDVAFAVSDHYIWNGGSVTSKDKKRNIFVSAAFNPEHKDYREVSSFAKQSIQLMSSFMPGIDYPYPQLTVVDGMDQMEFPMIINDNPIEDRTETITLVVHEVYHTLLPFYTGCNQTRYAWMDEAWATLSEWIVSPEIDSTIMDDYGLPRMLRASGNEWDVPVIYPSTEWHRSYSNNAYAKPGFALRFLREMITPEKFNKCIQHFVEVWKGKHPTPWDYFHCFNTAAGVDLNWYWKAWFYDDGEADTGIESVKPKGNNLEITMILKGNKPVPLYINLYGEKGLIKSEYKDAGIWQHANGRVTFTVPDNMLYNSIEVKGFMVPDVDESDNMKIIAR